MLQQYQIKHQNNVENIVMRKSLLDYLTYRISMHVLPVECLVFLLLLKCIRNVNLLKEHIFWSCSRI